MKKIHKVAVIMSVYNTPFNMVKRAIDSVLNQTMPPDEIIVELDNERLGAPITRDKAIKRVFSKYVAILDDDDYLLPNHLEVLFNSIEKENLSYNNIDHAILNKL